MKYKISKDIIKKVKIIKNNIENLEKQFMEYDIKFLEMEDEFYENNNEDDRSTFYIQNYFGPRYKEYSFLEDKKEKLLIEIRKLDNEIDNIIYPQEYKDLQNKLSDYQDKIHQIYIDNPTKYTNINLKYDDEVILLANKASELEKSIKEMDEAILDAYDIAMEDNFFIKIYNKLK